MKRILPFAAATLLASSAAMAQLLGVGAGARVGVDLPVGAVVRGAADTVRATGAAVQAEAATAVRADADADASVDARAATVPQEGASPSTRAKVDAGADVRGRVAPPPVQLGTRASVRAQGRVEAR